MTKKEYLKNRIFDLEKDVKNPFISRSQRRNEAYALLDYKLELQREYGSAFNSNGESSVGITL